MLYHIRGELILLEGGTAVIEANGVAYRMTVSQNTAVSAASHERKELRLFTHMAVREDGVELFGFYEKEELDAFRLLINVSGVGPKVALAVLSLFTPDRLAYAIAAEDAKSIARASGVGTKTAARIVLELRDKVSASLPNSEGGITSGKSAVLPKNSEKLEEAADALSVLGYHRTEISDALRAVFTDDMTTEQIITAALKRFSK